MNSCCRFIKFISFIKCNAAISFIELAIFLIFEINF